MKKVANILLAVLTAGLLLALPAHALAAPGDPASDPTASQYQNPGSTFTDQPRTEEPPSDDDTVALVSTPSEPASGSSGSSSGSLPFTGLDVGILALVAILLGATGLALRRFSAVK